MSKHKPLAGTDLGKAVCKHFGLNPNHVDVVSQIDFRPQAMASIKLTIMLTAEDLAGIARAAGASERATFSGGGYYPGGLALVGEEGPELINFADPNTAPEHTPDTATLTIKVDADEVKELLAKISEEFARQCAALEEAFIEFSGMAKCVSQALRKWDAEGMPLRK